MKTIRYQLKLSNRFMIAYAALGPVIIQFLRLPNEQKTETNKNSIKTCEKRSRSRKTC